MAMGARGADGGSTTVLEENGDDDAVLVLVEGLDVHDSLGDRSPSVVFQETIFPSVILELSAGINIFHDFVHTNAIRRQLGSVTDAARCATPRDGGEREGEKPETPWSTGAGGSPKKRVSSWMRTAEQGGAESAVRPPGGTTRTRAVEMRRNPASSAAARG